MSYEQFLQAKARVVEDCGFGVDQTAISPALFPFQQDIVRWALRRGRAAIFADTGLGKTRMQLEWARIVHEHTGRPVLILAPLAVASQTVAEGKAIGIDVNRCRSGDDVLDGLNVANYDRLHLFECSVFGGVVLDESSILKSYAGKTKRLICESFADTPFRLACTATPAPNDHIELGNHSEFLGVMPSPEMLSRWFINDTTSMGTYRLKGHARDDFWKWVASWGVALRRPSDIGHAGEGYDLPELCRVDHVIEATETNGTLFHTGETLSATEIHRQMRSSAPARAAKVAELVAGGDGSQWLIWCHTNYEADELLKAIPEAVEVRGSMTDARKEELLLGFADGSVPILITKPSIAGFGMNWQGCHQMAFVGVSYSYESAYQAIRRCWRFGQSRPVTVHFVLDAAEVGVLDVIERKQRQHAEMNEALYRASRGYMTGEKLRLSRNTEYETESGADWTLHRGDCCRIVQDIPDGSVDFSIFSPPFSSLYIYSAAMEDMGNSADDEEFFEHFRFLLPHLHRITRPGRLCAIHCKQLVYYKGDRGSAGLRDFRGRIIAEMVEAGWDYHSEVTLWKDPVTEMQRTKAHGLLHKTSENDRTFLRQGLPDYLVIFRKWPKEDAEAEQIKPVSAQRKGIGFQGFVGAPTNAPQASPEKDPRGHSIEIWQRYASPVWFDIDMMDVLNIRQARESEDEKHLCPLQLGVISRALDLWTNPGDVVFSPFAGIGSEGYESIRMGRRFIGCELKHEYFRYAVRNIEAAEIESRQGRLFA